MLRLVPKTDQFNRLLGDLSIQACLAAQSLKVFIRANNDKDRADAAAAIAATRIASRSLSHEITRELCRSFITPFDREDIHDLTEILYRIPKTVEKIKERIIAHKMFSHQADYSPQADIIAEEALALQDVMKSLLTGAKNKELLTKIDNLRELENKGDAVRNELLTKLFSREGDIRDLLLRRDIHDLLEKVVDRFRDAANVAFQIVFKHS
ncbi:MAG TPA: DUF47 family protein [Patescibacteria group bacterium]|jgi:hypothetical protein|nr:DUF47 family protein [Patescibacteria group bacterium]